MIAFLRTKNRSCSRSCRSLFISYTIQTLSENYFTSLEYFVSRSVQLISYVSCICVFFLYFVSTSNIPYFLKVFVDLPLLPTLPLNRIWCCFSKSYAKVRYEWVKSIPSSIICLVTFYYFLCRIDIFDFTI